MSKVAAAEIVVAWKTPCSPQERKVVALPPVRNGAVSLREVSPLRAGAGDKDVDKGGFRAAQAGPRVGRQVLVEVVEK